MRCLEFENQLDAYVANAMSGETRRAADAHLSSCGRCAALLAVVRGETEALPAAQADAIVVPLMQRTTGSACGAAQSRLVNWIDETLAAPDAQLVGAHVEHCGPCTQLARALESLRDDLPTFAHVQPDGRFVDDVMRATEDLRRRARPWTERERETWTHLSRRPRFAWELAYVATVVIVLLCGTPASPFRGVPNQALAVVQIDPTATIDGAHVRTRQMWGWVEGDVHRLWEASGGKALAAAHRAHSDFATDHPEATAAWSRLRAKSNDVAHAAANGNLGHMSMILSDMGDDAKALWKGLRTPSPRSRANPESGKPSN